ncbi:MAG: ABC transporter substrate-binding protein, partial [Dehalococcoidia bacterium]|nr:ABC transporter substrate-binding protein [Dehalococcoidia bacterium]
IITKEQSEVRRRTDMQGLARPFQRGMDRRTFLKLSGATGTLLIIWSLGCQPAGPRQAAEVNGATTGLNSLEALAFVHVAQAKGFFQQEGLKTQWTEFAGGGDTIRAVTMGGFHVAAGGWPAGLTAFEKGEPIRFIASVINVDTIVWIVPVNSPLKSMRDVRGKKVGVSRPGSLSMTDLQMVLKAEGIGEAEVQMPQAGGPDENWTAAKTGVIDVAWSSGAVAQRAILSGQARVIGRVRDYRKVWMGTGTGTSVTAIKEQPELIRSYLKAQQRALEFVANNSEEAGKIWGEAVGLDEALAVATIKGVPKEAWTSKIDPNSLLELQDEMISRKELSGKVDLKTFVDQSFLPQELRVQL